MSVHRSVSPSNIILSEESEGKLTNSDDEVVASYELRGSCYVLSVKYRQPVICFCLVDLRFIHA